MIVVVTERDEDNRVVVSHGFDVETNKIVIMPQVPLYYVGAYWNSDLNEWVVDDVKVNLCNGLKSELSGTILPTSPNGESL